jgi:hypothetical protein
MKLAINIFLFYMCMNLSCFFLASSGVFPSQIGISPSIFATNLTLPDLIIGSGILVGGVIISLVMHTFVGPAILIIWGLSYLTTNLGKWILTGLPQMLLQLGLPSYMAEIATGVVAFAVFLLVIEVTTQRDMT